MNFSPLQPQDAMMGALQKSLVKSLDALSGHNMCAPSREATVGKIAAQPRADDVIYAHGCLQGHSAKKSGLTSQSVHRAS